MKYDRKCYLYLIFTIMISNMHIVYILDPAGGRLSVQIPAATDLSR